MLIAKIIAKKNTGPQASRKPCGSKPSRPGAVAFLEDELGDAERGAGGEQVGDDADRRDQRGLQRDQQQQEAEAEDDADDQRRLARRARPRGRGSRRGRRRPSRRRAASERRRSIAVPSCLEDGSTFGIAWSRTTSPDAPGCGGVTWAMAGSAASRRAHARGVGGRGDDLERARGAEAEALLDELVALAAGVALGDDLDRRHAGVQREHGDRERAEDGDGGDAQRPRMPPEPLAPGGEAGAAMLAVVDPGQRELVDLGAELAEHGGQQRQRRGQDEDDREHDPDGHRAEGGAVDEHHRGQRDQHGQAAEQDGLAGGVHRLLDGVDAVLVLAEERAAEPHRR